MVEDIWKFSGSTYLRTTVLSSVSQSKSALNVFQTIGTGMFTLIGLLYS